MVVDPARTSIKVRFGGNAQPLKVPFTDTISTPGVKVALATWLDMSTLKVTKVFATAVEAIVKTTAHSTTARDLDFLLFAIYILQNGFAGMLHGIIDSAIASLCVLHRLAKTLSSFAI